MISSLKTKIIFSVMSVMLCTVSSYAQCTNTIKNPLTPINASLYYGIQTISTTQKPGEYFAVKNINNTSSQVYVFQSSISTDYFTIRDAANPSVIYFQGVSGLFGLQYFGNADSVQVHINLNSTCGTNAINRTTTINCTSCPLQCMNTVKYPASTVVANQAYPPVVVSTTQNPGQYYVVKNLAIGQTYSFASSNVDNITIRSAVNPSIIYAAGQDPLSYTPTTDSVAVHINLFEPSCGSNTINRTTTVQCSSCPAQCTNTFKYPSTTAIASQFNDTVIIATDQFPGDYYIIKNLGIGQAYVFNSTGNDLISIRNAGNPSIVYAAGPAPLSYVATTDSVAVHINLISPACGTNSVSRTTTVSCTTCPPSLILNYVLQLNGANYPSPIATPLNIIGTVDVNMQLKTMRIGFLSSNSDSGRLTSDPRAIHIQAATTLPYTGFCGVALNLPISSFSFAYNIAGPYINSQFVVFDLTNINIYNPVYVTANGGTVNTAFVALTTAMAAGKSYFDIHTTSNVGGEVRAFLTPLYTFIGNGSWGYSTNWEGGSKPPAILIDKGEIIIDPIAGGECVLQLANTQTIATGAKLTVKGAKKLRVVGNLIVQ